MKKVQEIKTIGDENYHYTSGYFPDNKWIDNDTLILERCVNGTIGYDDDDVVEFVKLSLKDYSVEVVHTDKVYAYFYFVYDNKIYYADRRYIKAVDIDTRKVKILYEHKGYSRDKADDNADFGGIHVGKDKSYVGEPTITADGKHIGFRISTSNKAGRMIVIDTETCEEVYSFEAVFPWPFYAPEHFMICPTNYKRAYFCHEGITQYVANRMWMYDDNEKKMWSFAKQRLDENGNLGDQYGHEMWAPDGKGMYVVKYPSSTIKPTGVMYVDVDTGKTEAVATGYRYWHICVSRDGKYLIGDTFEPDLGDKSKTEVVVVDLSDGSESLIEVAKTNMHHPAHPHPQLSPMSDKAIYNTLDKNDRLTVRIAYLK